MSKIIGLVGFIGSGKDTVADYMVTHHNFERAAFASALKDTLAVIFKWDRELLEGHSSRSRQWRDEVDNWWADKLNIPNLTPRWMLQNFGTELCRKHFNDSLWVYSLEKKLENTTTNTVITDCRFPNEIEIVKKHGGKLFWVQRGKLPDWYDIALYANLGIESAKQKLIKMNIHESETAWLGTDVNHILYNNKGITDLFKQIDLIV